MTTFVRFGGLLFGLGGIAWILALSFQEDVLEAAGPRIFMEPEITWSPESPHEGRLFRLRLTASFHTPIMGLRGEVAGEELHFEGLSEGVFESLAAIPVGSDSVVAAVVRVAYSAGGEAVVEARIPVTPGTYSHEQLTVTPRFGAPPNAADQEQLRQDQEKARAAARVAHRTPRMWSDEVVMPRASRVTSGFGDGREFNGQVSSRHLGLDLQGAQGDTVVAAMRGVVVLVEPFLLAGNIVYVNHGGGVLSAYFHLSRQLVQVGDSVDAGTPVGLIGATGRVTGPHLHWVVRYGMTSVDPRSLLDVVEPR